MKAEPETVLPVIRPNRSVWVLPSGQVVDIESEGRNDDDSAFSHGIFVKNWLRFRLDRFYPNRIEVEIARRIRKRALALLAEHPDLAQDSDEDGFPNPYSGDLAYNQAAEEEGWIRIKPLTQPRESTIYAETFSGKMTAAASDAIYSAASEQGCSVEVLAGGALANRASILSKTDL
jgi:hypothetical protein